MTKGQTAVHTVISIATFAGAIIAPVLYIGDIKSSTAVNTSKIQTLESNYSDMEKTINHTQQDVATTKAYLEALLPRNGINPRAIIDNIIPN